MMSFDLFHRFHEASAAHLEKAQKICRDIDVARADLGMRMDSMLGDNGDLHESLAKGLALMDMDIHEMKEFPPILLPWVSAHSLGNSFGAMWSSGTLLQMEDPSSEVGASCIVLFRQYKRIQDKLAKLLEEEPEKRPLALPPNVGKEAEYA